MSEFFTLGGGGVVGGGVISNKSVHAFTIVLINTVFLIKAWSTRHTVLTLHLAFFKINNADRKCAYQPGSMGA